MKRPKGIRMKELRPGSGDTAEKGKVVLIHYDCFLPRGERWASSRDKPYPVQFEVGKRNMCPAVEHGIVGMAVGGLRSVRVSPQLTYYERQLDPGLPKGVALRYEIELLRVAEEWDNSVFDTALSPPDEVEHE